MCHRLRVASACKRANVLTFEQNVALLLPLQDLLKPPDSFPLHNLPRLHTEINLRKPQLKYTSHHRQHEGLCHRLHPRWPRHRGSSYPILVHPQDLRRDRNLR